VLSELFSTRNLARFCGVAVLALAIVSPAQAGSTTIYRWRTDDGALGFADDMKRVPKEYRDQVEKKTIQSLSGYAKLTLEDTSTRTKRMEELDARIAYLEDMNQTLDEIRSTIDAPAVSAGPSGVSVFNGQVSGARGGNIGGISIPVDSATGKGPIVTESVRMYDPNSMTTRTNTITHQDGRIISVRRPKAAHQSLSEIQEEPQY
jgi:hypothetical protein